MVINKVELAQALEELAMSSYTMGVVSDLTPDKVLMVYSGRPGCACGCQGLYWYNPKYVELGSKKRGYTVEPSEVNKGQVTRIINILKRNIASVEMGGECLAYDTNKVYTRVILLPTA